MTAVSQGGGNFRELKSHLPLFTDATHRHDRGWPHPRPPPDEEDNPLKRRWKRVGILLFPHHEEDEGEGEAGNAGSG